MPKLSPTLTLIAGLAVFGASALFAELAASEAPVVRIDSGSLSGITVDGVTSFKGIPYVAPPIGTLRWRAPRPVAPWSGVMAADKFGPACMQLDDVPKSEDCLTLNVWRPADHSSSKLPVMVWIYGGALIAGRTSIYPLDGIASQGVVAVSMNYRVGRFGFFAHPALTAEAPDELHVNYGHMDQQAALQWIQRNIAAFGGDPSNVTIFGESAGGGSVIVHLTSPLSRGLFHRAIVQSPGVPTSRAKVMPLTDISTAEKSGLDYARSIGVTAAGESALSDLRALPANTLLENSEMDDEITALSAGRHVPGFAGTTQDGKLIVDSPEAILASARQAMVPVMVGANDRDLPIGAARGKDELFSTFGAEGAIARRIYDARGDSSLDELKQQVFADRAMVEPARHLANEMARAGQPTWLYRFGYVYEAFRDNSLGAPHSFEIPFTFNAPSAFVGENATAADKTMARIASGYWVQFAKTGDPNRDDLPIWPKHESSVDKLLYFTNSGVVVGADPLKPRLDLWQKVWASDKARADFATPAQAAGPR
jgi:para-nitrobenzyl esterase